MRMNQPNWSEHYKEQIQRNIGIISLEEQEKIRTTHVAILGVGGMGSRIAEILVRSGCERITIVDRDTYSITNLSTQPITKDDMGEFKVDILSEKFKNINPQLSIRTFHKITPDNISTILEGVQFATLSLDGPLGSILVTRECRKKKVPIVEAWSLPYMFAWWFTENSVDYETCYKLNTKNLTYSKIESMPDFRQQFRAKVFSLFKTFPQFEKYYSHDADSIEKMRTGEYRSFAPFVFITAGYIAFEIIFAGILKRIPMVLAPEINAFDTMTFKPTKFRVFN